jgi:rubrerythrin
MTKEKHSEKYYRDLAGQCTNKGLQNILTMLADEEARHYKTVAAMKTAAPPAHAETTVLADAKKSFARMRKAPDSLDFDINAAQLYRKAQQIEQASRQFYLKKAQQLTSPQQQIFRQLAEEENQHYFLLENIIDFISRPQTWLENAEFFHLDEY